MFIDSRYMLDRETSSARSVGSTLWRLGKYFAPYWPYVLVAFVLVCGVAGSQAYTATLIGQAVDCYVTPALSAEGETLAAAAANCRFAGGNTQGWSQAQLVRGLGGLIVWTAGIFVLSSLSRSLGFYTMAAAGNRVILRIRMELFARLHSLSMGYYNRNDTGDVMSRLTNDLDTLQQNLNFMMVSVVLSIISVIWIAAQMLVLNLLFGLMSLAVIPFMYVIAKYLSAQARREFRKARQEIGNINADLQENITGIRELQAFVREGATSDSFKEVNAANRDANIGAVSYTAALAPSLEALGYVGLAIVTVGGGWLLLEQVGLGGQALTLGLIITYINLVQRLNQPVGQIAVVWSNIQSAIAGSERIFDLLDERPEIVEAPDAEVLTHMRGHVELRNVCHSYVEGERVLNHVSLTARPGETVAIVGPTGAGKSTILNLIPRFYDPEAGTIAIDGHDVRHLTKQSLRAHIGIVLQDTFLFNDTIMNNIRFSRPDATDEEVIAAAHLAQVHAFVQSQPDGYQTLLGERGSGLSQGQRQLLSIARAMLADPRILILDEATSSVDTRTERQIQAALEQLMQHRTCFVVAHRLSTIHNADCVLMLQDGEIIERGTHDELLQQRGAYYALYTSQFQSLEAAPAVS